MIDDQLAAASPSWMVPLLDLAHMDEQIAGALSAYPDEDDGAALGLDHGRHRRPDHPIRRRTASG
jgi:hypothetical protein